MLIDVIIEKEKSGYIIGKFGKSIPNSGDQHPKMEIGQKQGFKYTYMYTYTFTLLFIQYNTVQNSTLQPTPTTHQTVVLYIKIFFAKNVGWQI